MTNHEYLTQLLDGQDLSTEQIATLQRCRDSVETQVGQLNGNPRFYYAGSYGKKTMIADSFDLDLVAYWPSECPYTLKDIFEAVGAALQQKWKSASPKTVAWTISFQGGFHIDVVPGRALDKAYKEANLYRSDKDCPMKTSIKVHIDTVRDSGRRDAIRLMKLWKTRNGVPWKKSLALELMTIEALKGTSTTDLEQQLLKVFAHVRDTIERVRIVDPANSNNVVSEELSKSDRQAIKAAAIAAIAARMWSEVFRVS
jgi:uncharacterized protein YnzC (UPF0291/DUF896 family)